jgi:hypothetical protein
VQGQDEIACDKEDPVRSLLLLMAAALSGGAPEAAYEYKLEKAADTVVARTEGKRTVFTIASSTGIGGATIRLKAGEWPHDILLRLQYTAGKPFTSLESFGITTDRLWAGGAMRDSEQVLFSFRNAKGELERDAREAPGGHYVTSGTLRIRVEPGKEGVDITLPANLLAGSRQVSLGWIDAFRR